MVEERRKNMSRSLNGSSDEIDNEKFNKRVMGKGEYEKF